MERPHGQLKHRNNDISIAEASGTMRNNSLSATLFSCALAELRRLALATGAPAVGAAYINLREELRCINGLWD